MNRLAHIDSRPLPIVAISVIAVVVFLSCGDDGTNPDPDPAPPAAPGGFAGMATSDSAVVTSWTDASDNEDGFLLFREAATAKKDSLIATLPEGSAGYEDRGLQGGTTYNYRLLSFNSDGESEAAVTSATTFLTPPTERFFPADFLDTYQLVRDCRFSSSHPLQISVYVNPESAEDYLQGNYPLKEGTVCVKTVSNGLDCSIINEFVAMLKGPPGAAPASGDWWWQVATPDMEVDSSGVLSSCISAGCHVDCQITDWVCAEP